MNVKSTVTPQDVKSNPFFKATYQKCKMDSHRKITSALNIQCISIDMRLNIKTKQFCRKEIYDLVGIVIKKLCTCMNNMYV